MCKNHFFSGWIYYITCLLVRLQAVWVIEKWARPRGERRIWERARWARGSDGGARQVDLQWFLWWQTLPFSGCQKMFYGDIGKEVQRTHLWPEPPRPPGWAAPGVERTLGLLPIQRPGNWLSFVSLSLVFLDALANNETTNAAHITIYFTSRTDFKLLRCMIFFPQQWIIGWWALHIVLQSSIVLRQLLSISMKAVYQVIRDPCIILRSCCLIHLLRKGIHQNEVKLYFPKKLFHVNRQSVGNRSWSLSSLA